MDKNTIIGLVIIFLILIGFSYLNRPSEEQRREMMRRDSIARVEQQQRALEAQRLQEERENTEHSATGTSTRSTVFARAPSLPKTALQSKCSRWRMTK